MTVASQQTAVRCVIMRGGTSKGLYFHADDLPPGGDARDRVLKRLMGSPDILQIDGLGGSRPVTSKVAIIAPSARGDADVDYTFGQVDIERDLIGYVGNCGNISSGVEPFAIDEGLVAATEPTTTVRIYNTNTDKVLVAQVPVTEGRARVTGDCVIAGVPGSGAEIVMDYSATAGAVSGRLLPTGHASDPMTLEDGRSFDVTLCDVGNPCVFVAATDLGLSGSELPEAISSDAALMATIGEIQAKAGQLFGVWTDWRQVQPGLPPVGHGRTAGRLSGFQRRRTRRRFDGPASPPGVREPMPRFDGRHGCGVPGGGVAHQRVGRSSHARTRSRGQRHSPDRAPARSHGRGRGP